MAARRGTLGLMLALALTVLPGCTSDIEVLQPAGPAGAATVVPQEHDLALVAVEFDPPLSSAQVLADGVTLLVAVENRGLTDEQNVGVTARLCEQASGGGQVELLAETITLDMLRPGEIRAVRFTQVSQLPLRADYGLVLELMPVPGESYLADNARTYDIRVHLED